MIYLVTAPDGKRYVVVSDDEDSEAVARLTYSRLYGFRDESDPPVFFAKCIGLIDSIIELKLIPSTIVQIETVALDR